MFYEAYLREKTLRTKLKARLQANRIAENEPVTITDLVIYSKNADYSYGESRSHSNGYQIVPVVSRLIDQIQFLADLARLHHQKQYCDLENGNYKIKNQYLNHITRLSLSEFSLYTSKPLTLQEFVLIFEQIQTIASACEENIHLLLSSFAVINETNEILNLSLYVQGGKEPKFEVFSKGAPSSIDVAYENSTNFTQQKTDLRTIGVSQFISNQDENIKTISAKSVFTIVTKGGAKYKQAVDVCRDNANMHSLSLFSDDLAARKTDAFSFIPDQVNQIVTSNSIHFTPDSRLSETVVHVDPRPEFNTHSFNSLKKEVSNSIETQSLVEKIKKYPDMKLIKSESGFTVTKPPFGSDFEVVIHQEKKLETYCPLIKKQVERANELIMKKKIDEMISNNPGSKNDGYNSIVNSSTSILLSGKFLIAKLVELCQPSMFEAFLNLECPLKQAAELIIKQSFASLSELSEGEDDMIYSIALWTKDLTFKLNNLNDKIPFPFITQLTDEVQQFDRDMKLTIAAVLTF
jgi:hypothetical protein